MSNRIVVGAAMGIAVLVSLPAASEAHCFGYKQVRSEVSAAVNDTTAFANRVVYRTEKFGHRLFGWLDCKKI